MNMHVLILMVTDTNWLECWCWPENWRKGLLLALYLKLRISRAEKLGVDLQEEWAAKGLRPFHGTALRPAATSSTELTGVVLFGLVVQ